MSKRRRRVRDTVIRVLAAVLSVLVVAACAPRTETAPASGASANLRAPVRAPEVPPTQDTRQVLDLVNEARTRSRACGDTPFAAAPPVAWSSALALAAERHSRAMASDGFLDHVSPSGGTVGDRIAATGYQARAWGETIAGGYVDPGETVAGFLASPPHCAVLMSASFSALGAALVEDDDSVFLSYWTLVLAAPR
jgi:uncharacterized protein YkwD